MVTKIIGLCVLAGLSLQSLAGPSGADKPALIPLPQELTWQTGKFQLSGNQVIKWVYEGKLGIENQKRNLFKIVG